MRITFPGSRLDPPRGRSVASRRSVRKVPLQSPEGATGAEQTYAAGTPRLLRAINERTVLEFIRRAGPVSRAQIARDSGLSKPTVSQALTSLTGARLVKEAGRTSGNKGPTAQLYELNPDAGWVMGLDVGSDRVRGAIADLTGRIEARRDERSRARGARSLITQIGELAHGLAETAGVRWRQVKVVTVGSPGVFDPDREQMALAHNLPGWGRHGVVDALRGELDTHVTFENDVNLATVGEQSHGLGRGVANFAYLHIGTGVGMGLVLNGELFRGSRGAAGEVAYLPLAAADPHDPESLRHGALEAAVGAGGVVAIARQLGMSSPLSPKRVFAAARRGDDVAARVVALVAERIALAIAAVVPVIDPELVVLGGGIGRNGDMLLSHIEEELGEITPFRPRIEISVLGAEAELRGAVATALTEAQERLFPRGVGGGIAV